jgi:ubiquinone/menaquinone biosynthesis C-methylase UbiE
MRQILSALQVKPTDRVVELGCGVGDYAKEIAQRTKTVTGVDLNVDGARRRYPDVDFLAADSNKQLPFADASTDVVVSINTIEHLRDPDKFLREIARILKPQGRVALTTANLDFFLHRRFFDKTHLHEWTLPEFRALVSRTFVPAFVEKSSSMFKYHPANKLLTLFLKPDMTFVGLKPVSSGS